MASSSEDGACGSSGIAIYKVLRDIYCSEELKIESKRCKNFSSTIDTLCTGENTTSFCALFELVSKEIEQKKKELSAKCKLFKFQASYMYQAERLPVVLQRLGKEEEGNVNDSILWQVAELAIISASYRSACNMYTCTISIR